MAISKQLKDDYEVRGEYKHINVRTKTSIIEDGKEISYSYHRKVLTPDMDISSESDEIKALAGAIWTDAVKESCNQLKKKLKMKLVK